MKTYLGHMLKNILIFKLSIFKSRLGFSYCLYTLKKNLEMIKPVSNKSVSIFHSGKAFFNTGQSHLKHYCVNWWYPPLPLPAENFNQIGASCHACIHENGYKTDYFPCKHILTNLAPAKFLVAKLWFSQFYNFVI